MKEFRSLYENNYKRVFYYLKSLCRNEKLAEDLAQETFYRVLTLLCGGRMPKVSDKWFIKVAHNIFLDYLRKNQTPVESLEGHGSLIAAPVEDSARRLDILETLGALPVRYRSLILLKDHYGFTNEEISELTGSSVSAVKITLMRARNKFKEVYGA